MSPTILLPISPTAHSLSRKLSKLEQFLVVLIGNPDKKAAVNNV